MQAEINDTLIRVTLHEKRNIGVRKYKVESVGAVYDNGYTEYRLTQTYSNEVAAYYKPHYASNERIPICDFNPITKIEECADCSIDIFAILNNDGTQNDKTNEIISMLLKQHNIRYKSKKKRQ